MTMYQLTSSGTSVIRLSDGATIPLPPNESEGFAYQQWLDAGNTPLPVPVITAEQLKATGSVAIQNLLDSTALAHGYDSLERCISYIGDADAFWSSEGMRAKAWRSECWSKAKQIQDDATAGNWPTVGAGQMPTIADVLAAMPPANWPV